MRVHGAIYTEEIRSGIVDKIKEELEGKELSIEIKEKYEEFINKYDLYKEYTGTIIPSKPNEIMINGEKLRNTEDILKDFKNQSEEKGKDDVKIDLSQKNFSNFTQDRILKSIYGEMPEIPEEDIKILKEYKQHLSVKYNNMLRGKIQLTDLSETVESILQLDKIFKKFPENPANINVYRVGNGVGKSRNDGDKVLYSQVISTSTSKDIGQFFNANILYQRELQKGEKAIPLDLVLPYFNVGKAAQSSECELLLQPCTYEVENLDSNVVKMKNAKEINVDELLEKRLEEIKNKLQNKDEYIQYLCEQAKSENKYDNSNVKQEKLQDLFTELEKNNKLEILKEKDKK